MSEMALTADEVVIIGKGQLISQTSIEELLSQSTDNFVRVRSPEAPKLKTALEEVGAVVVLEDDGSLSVRGANEVAIGDWPRRSRSCCTNSRRAGVARGGLHGIDRGQHRVPRVHE